MRALLCFCVLLLAACTTAGPRGPAGPAGPAGDAGAAGGSVTTAALSPGDSHCANGGVSVTSSAGTSYVCNGDGSAGAGATVTPLGPGDPNCPNGGAQIVAGATTTYACTGSPGASVTSATLVPGDPNCPFGGSKFTTASGTTFACSGGAGNLTVTSPLNGYGNAANPLGLNLGSGLTLSSPNLVLDFPSASPVNGSSNQPSRWDHVHPPQLFLPLADFGTGLVQIPVGPTSLVGVSVPAYTLEYSSVTIPNNLPASPSANLVLSFARSGAAASATINAWSTGVKYGAMPASASMCGLAAQSLSLTPGQLSQVTIPLTTSVCGGSPQATGSGDLVSFVFRTNSGDPSVVLVGARVDFLP
jgi:hypothetical protein